MKNLAQITRLILVLLVPCLLYGQKKIEVTNEKIMLSAGNQPVYKVKIPQADLENVKKDWSKIIKQNTKSKIIITSSEINITATLIEEIYDKPFNIYSALLSEDSAVSLVAAFEIDSVFFEFNEENKNIQTEKIHNSIKTMMRNFAVDQYKNAVQDQLDNEEKKLNDLKSEYKTLNGKVESDRKEIKGNEQNIKNSEDAIASYENENEIKVQEINEKNKDISTLKNDPELHKLAKDQLKELEKDKKTIEKNLEKERKNIVTYQANIEDLNRLIEENLKLIGEKNSEIETQQQYIKKITGILQGIK